MRISEEEWQKLKALADAVGISASDYVRAFIIRQAKVENVSIKPSKK